MKKKVILVAGAGGFIGGHLVASLRQREHFSIRSVDIKPVSQWYQCFPDAENIVADLREKSACERVCDGADEIYNLAADMGGMGFIENNKALCMLSVLINTHLLQAACKARVGKFFYASSACVYNAEKQQQFDVSPLKEADAYPAMPEDGYGWEKLFSERMCRHFEEDFSIQTRVARFHNVYGPNGTWDGGREKAPAAICRKVIEGIVSGREAINIWGDGRQTRSFTFVEDCIYGIDLIMNSQFHEPLNLGSSEMVSINQLVDIVEGFFGVPLQRHYQLDAPKGVNGRNSDNTLISSLFDWEPGTSLVSGMRRTCAWIRDEFVAKAGVDSIDPVRLARLYNSELPEAQLKPSEQIANS